MLSRAHLPERGFRVALVGGTGREARQVLVTTGLVSEYPDIPGLHERRGGDVAHCPYCFGWELRDEPGSLPWRAYGWRATSRM